VPQPLEAPNEEGPVKVLSLVELAENLVVGLGLL
jgi:hypothetical protein